MPMICQSPALPLKSTICDSDRPRAADLANHRGSWSPDEQQQLYIHVVSGLITKLPPPSVKAQPITIHPHAHIDHVYMMLVGTDECKPTDETPNTPVNRIYMRIF